MLAGAWRERKDKAYIVSFEYGNMKGQELHGKNSQDPLQTIDDMRYLQELIGKLLGLLVTMVTDNNGAALEKEVSKIPQNHKPAKVDVEPTKWTTIRQMVCCLNLKR